MSSKSKTQRGMDLLKFPATRLRQYRQQDPDGDDARAVHDPHTWDDPDPSWRERITPDTTAGWMLAAVGFLAIGGLLLYLLPIVGPTYRNDRLLIGVAIIGAVVGFHLWSRQRGFEAGTKNYDKSVIYYGDEAEVRLGEYLGTDGRSHLFTPFVSISYGGFNPRRLKKRDLPFDPAQLRSNSGRRDEIGEEPVVDRLNTTTAKVDTENSGTVLVTHAGGMEFDGFGRESDRFTTRPVTIDEDIAHKMNQLLGSLERSVETLEQQLAVVEERSEALRETNRAAIVDELRGALALMERMSKMAAMQRYPQHQQGDDEGLNFSKNGHDIVQGIEDDLDEELEGL